MRTPVLLLLLLQRGQAQRTPRNPFGSLALSIPPPTNASDVGRVVENLKLKRQYFVSNQGQVTKENIDKVEKLLAKSSVKDSEEATADAEEKRGRQGRGLNLILDQFFRFEWVRVRVGVAA